MGEELRVGILILQINNHKKYVRTEKIQTIKCYELFNHGYLRKRGLLEIQ